MILKCLFFHTAIIAFYSIDPSKVTITALQNAASVAGTILLTECVVVDHADQKSPTPDGNGQF